MKKILNLTLSLGCVCAISGSLLFYANEKTAPVVEQKQIQQKLEAFRKVLPEFDNDLIQDKIEIDDVTFYPAKKDNQLVAIAGEASAKGYGGEIKVMVKIDLDGKIGLIQVLSHNETPGIGTKVTDRIRKKSFFDFFKKKNNDQKLIPNEYLDSYNGKVLARNIKVDAVSGATISSRGVLSAVKKIGEVFQENQEKLLPKEK